MREKMSICVNGESQVPPGFRFHPTEEELLQYYLRKKVSYEKIDLDVIRDVDLNRLEPWDIQEKCKIGSTPQNDWYFFSHKDKKYPTGTRTNRATSVGFWKATGRDKVIYSNTNRIGMRKTLVFYRGRAPNGQKSDWIMHEYRLDDTDTNTRVSNNNAMGDTAPEEGWVVCRVFKKKKNNPKSPSASHVFDSCDEGALEQEKLPSLDSPKYKESNNINNNGYHPVEMVTESEGLFSMGMGASSSSSMVIGGACGGLTNWETLDRLVASQLNDPTMGYYCSDLQFPTFLSSSIATTTHSRAATSITPTLHDYTSDDIDLWNFVRSTTSEPLCHFSNTSNLTM